MLLKDELVCKCDSGALPGAPSFNSTYRGMGGKPRTSTRPLIAKNRDERGTALMNQNDFDDRATCLHFCMLLDNTTSFRYSS